MHILHRMPLRLPVQPSRLPMECMNCGVYFVDTVAPRTLPPPVDIPPLSARQSPPGGRGDCKGISRQIVVPSTDASKPNTSEATFALMLYQHDSCNTEGIGVQRNGPEVLGTKIAHFEWLLRGLCKMCHGANHKRHTPIDADTFFVYPALRLPSKDNCGPEADNTAKKECIIPLFIFAHQTDLK